MASASQGSGPVEPSSAPVRGTGATGANVSSAVIKYLEAHQGSAKYMVAAVGSNTAGTIALQSGRNVIDMGGFMGADPAPTLAQVQHLIDTGQLHYILLGGSGGGPGSSGAVGGPGAGSAQRSHGPLRQRARRQRRGRPRSRWARRYRREQRDGRDPRPVDRNPRHRGTRDRTEHLRIGHQALLLRRLSGVAWACLDYPQPMSAWGASAADAAVSVTFDNLGEAAQLELGMWPEDVPHGEHFTVLEVLPRLLELLAARGVRATFFVEGLNAEMYPDALRDLAQAGHEVAVHAWRHEEWAALDAATEAALLDRATDAMRSIGLEPRGFRPPGGGLTARTLSLLGERGYSYVSPAGEREGMLDGLAVLPFRWQLVDAYAFLPQFAGLRERYRGDPEPYGPEQMGEEMIAALHAHTSAKVTSRCCSTPSRSPSPASPGGPRSMPCSRRQPTSPPPARSRLPRMDEAAAWMLTHAEDFNHPPQLDDATWMAPG